MPDPRHIRISEYDYRLPEERIAFYPLKERDQSRLLVWNKGQIRDESFSALPSQLPARSLLVFNNSRVIRARLCFTRHERAPLEIFCLEPEQVQNSKAPAGEAYWHCLVGRLKSWKAGRQTQSAGDITLHAEVLERNDENVIVRFLWEPASLRFEEVLERAGRVPLPPYIDRDAEDSDNDRYQTVYAAQNGSVAAPTAGLHFTPAVLTALREKGIKTTELTLHVGSGTFRPVKSELAGDHVMHGEWFTVHRELLQSLLDQDGPVVAVGTTSMRALESLYWLGAKLLKNEWSGTYEVLQWEPYDKEVSLSGSEAIKAILDHMKNKKLPVLTCRTSILIAPGYRTRIVTGLITNFHQPASTLLLLVAALAGKDWKIIYDHALRNGYRFLSYGDSSLLLP